MGLEEEHRNQGEELLEAEEATEKGQRISQGRKEWVEGEELPSWAPLLEKCTREGEVEVALTKIGTGFLFLIVSEEKHAEAMRILAQFGDALRGMVVMVRWSQDIFVYLD